MSHTYIPFKRSIGCSRGGRGILHESSIGCSRGGVASCMKGALANVYF